MPAACLRLQCKDRNAGAAFTLAELRQGKAIAHRYRNRRIGEFLKELELSEGRGTGIPKILHAMKRNGSPEPQFETDEDRTYFVARLPLRPAKTGQADDDPNDQPASSYDSSVLVTGQVTGQVAGQALRFCANARRAADIQKQIGIKHRETFLQNYLRPLLAIGWLAPTLPDTPRSPNQRYVTTDLGRKQLTKFPAA